MEWIHALCPLWFKQLFPLADPDGINEVTVGELNVSVSVYDIVFSMEVRMLSSFEHSYWKKSNLCRSEITLGSM